jgi:hypothetical protein
VSSLKLLVLSALAWAACFPAAAQTPDELAAARVLGPQWQQMSRDAGMVFSGTVLRIAPQNANGSAVPTIELKFKVDRAIAGVRSGQTLTVREWAGAWSLHRPMRVGDHVLLLLYPRSKLGLTSPVNGSAGQIALDGSGKPAPLHEITANQLERAIRSAREQQ